jgi:hypothetical protein
MADSAEPPTRPCLKHKLLWFRTSSWSPAMQALCNLAAWSPTQCYVHMVPSRAAISSTADPPLSNPLPSLASISQTPQDARCLTWKTSSRSCTRARTSDRTVCSDFGADVLANAYPATSASSGQTGSFETILPTAYAATACAASVDCSHTAARRKLWTTCSALA